MRRRDVWRVLLMPQLIVGLMACFLAYLVDGSFAARSAAVGSVIVIVATFAGGFIALGPHFNRAGIAFSRIMLGEFLKIIIVLFLFALMLKATTLFPLFMLVGLAATLLGSFLSFKMLD